MSVPGSRQVLCGKEVSDFAGPAHFDIIKCSSNE